MPTDRDDDVPAPGDITRGTEAQADARPAATPSQEFAERQSFADPVHKEGGIRTQESGNQEGGHTGPSAPATTTDAAELQRASEEE